MAQRTWEIVGAGKMEVLVQNHFSTSLTSHREIQVAQKPDSSLES